MSCVVIPACPLIPMPGDTCLPYALRSDGKTPALAARQSGRYTVTFDGDRTQDVKDGANELEVKVTNQWPNRLIGDEQFPDDLDEPLLSSGLIGPVVLECVTDIRLP